jgi:hypothetical protein
MSQLPFNRRDVLRIARDGLIDQFDEFVISHSMVSPDASHAGRRLFTKIVRQSPGRVNGGGQDLTIRYS